ncbi:hypothetical protein ATL41_1993 [Flavimobilis soli]|uniref:Uncharacterized protein n=1 Tax=Flavimobilis soli TaxID=442709 RepID=A0A2A9EG93_9MICO|nr:hypothetical protein [Flavimobilis soli]PFG37239.1 hypothetical protein ATL41_1993 [Flavimobilis soli]
MHQVRPAIIVGPRRASRATLALLVFIVILLAGSLTMALGAFAAPDATSEITGVAPELAKSALGLESVTVSDRMIFVASSVVFAVALWGTYISWRTTSHRYGFVEQEVVPTGLRIVRRRAWGRTRSLVVGLGGQLDIDAGLTLSRRGGLERRYRFTFSSGADSFSFDAPIYIEKLSMAPLDKIADQLGITLNVTDAAEEMQRDTSTSPTDLLGRS